MPKLADPWLAALSRYRRERWRVQRAKAAFAKRGLVPRSPDRAYLERIDAYWRAHLGRRVNPLWHLACTTVTGVQDVRFVPQDAWFDEILPAFNRMSMRPAYLDKNLADLLLGRPVAPHTLVKRMHGRYYDEHDRPWSRQAAQERLLAHDGDAIVKGSRTDDGVNVRAVRVAGGVLLLDGRPADIVALERSHGSDFIVQERIRQGATMAEPHPDSVNTVRILTFRWGDEPRVLLAFARFGVDGRITDNAGTGGVCCGIDADGRLRATGVDEHGMVHAKHPTSGYDFSQQKAVPNFGAICRQALALHERIYHFDLVSWDFATRADDTPLFLEMNFQGVSYIYQFAWGAPMFGDLTEDVLAQVRSRAGRRAA